MKAATTIALTFLMAFTAPAGADWIRGMMLEDCSERSRNILADSVRKDIEFAVRRAEASIEPPAPIGDLGCLDGLMDIDLGVFAPIGSLSNLFSNSLDGSLTDPEGSGQICRFAQTKWNEISRPLLKPLDQLRLGLPPGFAESFAEEAKGASARNSSPPPQSSLGTPPARNAADRARTTESGHSDPIEGIWDSIFGWAGE